MSIPEVFKNYEKGILKKLNIMYSGLFWCELGNQSYAGKMAKLMYEKMGVNHTSIDINGLGGAIALNLDLPIPDDLGNKFDVITNYGTTEHVNNQYSVFKNIHIMCKSNGIMIHGVPLIGNWKGHCRYYYSKEFFKNLSKICNYSIVDLTIFDKDFYKKPKSLVGCVLKKNSNSFMKLKTFLKIFGLKDSKNKKRTGNYTKK